MAKYDPLGDYLSERRSDTCVLTFFQVEEIIGAALPPSARKDGPWWGNDRTHTQACSWLRAGWKVDQTHLEEKRVRFARIKSGRPSRPGLSGGKTSSQVIVRNLDPEVVARIKRTAKRKGRSLEQELRTVLVKAARPDRTELLAEADRIRAMSVGPLEDSVAILRQDRDYR